MKVEVWSDFVCPFCYIGKRRFENGLAQFAHRDAVQVIYRSFELDANADKDPARDVHDMLAAKYGMSREQAVAMHDDVGRQAKASGLLYRFDTMIRTNTFDAHRLSHFAGRYGKRGEVTELLFKAYFGDSKHIGESDTLVEIAAEAGIDRDEAAAVLAGKHYADQVRRDEQEGEKLGVRGVPFFLMNRKFAVSGAQPSEVFLEALQKSWEEEELS